MDRGTFLGTQLTVLTCFYAILVGVNATHLVGTSQGCRMPGEYDLAFVVANVLYSVALYVAVDHACSRQRLNSNVLMLCLFVLVGSSLLTFALPYRYFTDCGAWCIVMSLSTITLDLLMILALFNYTITYAAPTAVTSE